MDICLHCFFGYGSNNGGKPGHPLRYQISPQLANALYKSAISVAWRPPPRPSGARQSHPTCEWDTRGQTLRNDLFAGPLRLRAAAADRTRAGTDPDVATDSDCASLLAADLDVTRMFTSLSAAYYTKYLFICGRFSYPSFFPHEISFSKTARIDTTRGQEPTFWRK